MIHRKSNFRIQLLQIFTVKEVIKNTKIMNTKNLKLAITIMTIALFTSCKSSGSKINNSTSQRRQGSQPSVEQLFKEMDSNKDGKLSKVEVKGPLKNDFSKIDTDDDGYLSEAEIENAPKPERQGGQVRPQRPTNRN